MRVVFELTRGADPQDVLERLLAGTQMRASLSYSAMALVRVGGVAQPECLSLRDLLVRFIEHRLDVIVRRSRHELERARARLHIVEGLLVALDDIDAVVAIIRRSQRAETARNNLVRRLKITEAQAAAILEMPLKRLASLERRRLAEERDALAARVDELEGLLASRSAQLEVVIEETREIKARYAEPRRTVIVDGEAGQEAAALEDLTEAA